MNQPETADARESDKWIPWLFVLFFVVIAIVDGAFATIAIKTKPGLVTENAFEKGLSYNKTLEAAQAQEKLGWQGDVALEGDRLVFRLKDGDGILLQGAKITARIVRPVQNGYDFEAPLAETAPGVYESEIHFPLKGQWGVRVFAQWQDKHYQSAKTLMVR